MKEVSEECESLNINFHLLLGDGEELVTSFVEENSIGAVVVDFSPLRMPLSWIETLKTKLPKDVALCQVYICRLLLFSK